MKKPAASTGRTFALFKKGQLWKIGDGNLLITAVGKTLVYYKEYRTHPNGKLHNLSSKLELQIYLLD